jgi:P27 family predicted phage terminase small subunit
MVKVDSDRTRRGRNKKTLEIAAPDLGTAKKPKHLTGPASDAWDELAPLLKAVGALTRADSITFEVLCTLYGHCRQLDRVIQAEGVMLVKDGMKIPHPGLAQLNQLAKSFDTSAKSFGLTPLSRERLWPILQLQKARAERKQEEENNPFAELARERSKSIN